MIFSYITSTVQFSYCKRYYSSANVDMSRICNHTMLQQTQPVDSHGGITIAACTRNGKAVILIVIASNTHIQDTGKN